MSWKAGGAELIAEFMTPAFGHDEVRTKDAAGDVHCGSAYLYIFAFIARIARILCMKKLWFRLNDVD